MKVVSEVLCLVELTIIAGPMHEIDMDGWPCFSTSSNFSL